MYDSGMAGGRPNVILSVLSQRSGKLGSVDTKEDAPIQHDAPVPSTEPHFFLQRGMGSRRGRSILMKSELESRFHRESMDVPSRCGTMGALEVLAH